MYALTKASVFEREAFARRHDETFGWVMAKNDKLR